MASSSSSSSSKLSDQLKRCKTVLQALTALEYVGAFAAPVDWKALNLLDYLKVIRTPMDLGTIQTKLEGGAYGSSQEFRHDVNLVWTNCMTYNTEGDYHKLAFDFQKLFEQQFVKMSCGDVEPLDPARAPTIVDRRMCHENMYNISAKDLGAVMQVVRQRSEASIVVKTGDTGKIVLDVGAIDSSTFWLVDAMVKDSLPGEKQYSKSKGEAAAATAAAGGQDKQDKGRIA